MEHIEKSIEVNAPLSAVYNQWTQFEEFPRFMEGVKEVRQQDDRRLFWRAEILGKDVEWEAEIFEQIPDQRIAWRSVTGHPNMGAVSFASNGSGGTTVTLVMDYEPLGITEKIGDALGLVSMRIEGDLNRFRKLIENRKTETGAWRGEIRSGTTK